MIVFLFTTLLWATEYVGVNIYKVEGLKSSRFQTFETGWVGATADGLLRVYVGTSEQDAIRWINAMKRQLYTYQFPVIEQYADEAYGDQINIMMVRYGNIGLLTQGSNVGQWMIALEAEILDNSTPIPSVPRPIVQQNQEGEFQVTTRSGSQFNFVGGEPVYSPKGLAFRTLPRHLTVWDEYARGTAWVLNQDKTSFTPREKSRGHQPK